MFSGAIFTLLTYGSRIGEFIILDLPLLNPGLTWEPQYNATSFVLKVAGREIPEPSMFGVLSVLLLVGAYQRYRTRAIQRPR